MNVEVINLRDYTPHEVSNTYAAVSRFYTYYVGRATPRSRHPIAHVSSPLANPFKLSSDSNRMNVIRRYERWLRGQLLIAHSPQSQVINRIIQKLKDGNMVELACWCHPQPCHADVIAKIIQEQAAGR